MKNVSTPERAWFICAMISSDSKSDTARRPLTMKSASSSLASCVVRLAKQRDRDVRQVGDRLLDHRLALVELEQRRALLRVAHGRDDDLVEVARGHLDDLEVAVVEGIERPRVEDPGHGVNATAGRGRPHIRPSSDRSRMVTWVRP